MKFEIFKDEIIKTIKNIDENELIGMIKNLSQVRKKGGRIFCLELVVVRQTPVIWLMI